MIVAILSLVIGLLGLVAAAMLYRWIVQQSTGDSLMTAIVEEIHYRCNDLLMGAISQDRYLRSGGDHAAFHAVWF